LKVVNADSTFAEAEIAIEGVSATPTSVRKIVLANDNLTAVNTFEQPGAVVPVETAATLAPNRFKQNFPRFSMTVLRVPVK
jgi:alpha-L-arabinofuranosidase